MKDLIKKAFLRFLNEYGVFVDSGEDSTDCIRRMLNKDLIDVNEVAFRKNCEDWLDVFIELRDEMLDNEELLSVQMGDDTFLYVLPEDKENLFDNLSYYSEYPTIQEDTKCISKIANNICPSCGGEGTIIMDMEGSAFVKWDIEKQRFSIYDFDKDDFEQKGEVYCQNCGQVFYENGERKVMINKE